MSEVSKFFREIKKETIIGAAAMLILGILVLLGTIDIVCKVIGVILMVLGAIYIVLYIVNLIKNVRISYQLIVGFSLAVLGVIFFFENMAIREILYLIFAAAMIIDGATKLDNAIQLFRGRNPLGWAVLIFALAITVVGVLVIFKVISGDTVIGVVLIVDGVLDLLTILFLTTKYKKRIAC